jgi:N-acetyl-gamma-glutamyl-phosphate reductase
MLINVTIIGASGYSGAELVKILAGHPGAHIKAITSTSRVGQRIADLYQNLLGISDLTFSALNVDEAALSDVVFLALPHGQAMDIVPKLVAAGPTKIIDLSGDFRLPADAYEAWYKKPHSAASLVDRAVYGLTEINRAKIASAEIVANPGCFPTGIALAAAPLIAAEAVEAEITANCLTGVSGAGRTATDTTHFCRADENALAYKIGGAHQHIPEIEQMLNAVTAERNKPGNIRVAFTPILAPFSRGIYSILTATPNDELNDESLLSLYRDFYKDEPFVKILAPGQGPQVKTVAGSNYCHIGFAVDRRLNKITVLSAIDNLVKGAAGQAVQNMNVMFGFDEATGLSAPGLYP